MIDKSGQGQNQVCFEVSNNLAIPYQVASTDRPTLLDNPGSTMQQRSGHGEPLFYT